MPKKHVSLVRTNNTDLCANSSVAFRGAAPSERRRGEVSLVGQAVPSHRDGEERAKYNNDGAGLCAYLRMTVDLP
eukprot:gene19255-29659_t